MCPVMVHSANLYPVMASFLLYHCYHLSVHGVSERLGASVNELASTRIIKYGDSRSEVNYPSILPCSKDLFPEPHL